MRINSIRLVIDSIRYRYNTLNSKNFIQYLRRRGVHVGEDVVFYEPRTIVVDVTMPSLITIGNNVRITRGVTILSHGADWHVLKEIYHEPLGSAGAVTIMDNVFIGINAIILKDVTIHENCIIGAGSVVAKDIPAGSVAGGNPAKPIMGIEEYYGKRKKLILEEAYKYAWSIYDRYKRLPIPEEFREFFYLFMERDPAKFGKVPVEMQVGKYYKEFLESKPYFNSFEEFLRYCKIIS